MRRTPIRLALTTLLALPLGAAGAPLPPAGAPPPPAGAAPASPLSAAPPAPEGEARKQALVAIEKEWLAARDAATLERILADDFLHPVPQGVILTKAQHIDGFKKHPPAGDRKERFERLQVRIYGDVGIADGIVVAKGDDGKERRTVFTDVFVYRDGRWQAVNAQENAVERPAASP